MKLIELERLKGFATLSIFAAHLPFFGALFPSWSRPSWTGVDLFFVISAYTLTRAWCFAEDSNRGESRKHRLGKYLFRRMFRILPVAWLVLALVLVGRFFPMARFFGESGKLQSESLTILGLCFNYFCLPMRTVLAPFWSLMVEIHLYLLLPVFFFALPGPRSRLWGAAALIVASVLARPVLISLGPAETDARVFTHLRLDTLFAGVWLALWSPKVASGAKLPWVFLGWALLASLVVVPQLGAAFKLTRAEMFAPTWLVASGLVLLASLDRGILLAIPGVSRGLEWVGERCLPIYLFQLPLFALLKGFSAQYPELRVSKMVAESLDPAASLARLLPANLVFFALLIPLVGLCHRFWEIPAQVFGQRVSRALFAGEAALPAIFPPRNKFRGSERERRERQRRVG